MEGKPIYIYYYLAGTDTAVRARRPDFSRTRIDFKYVQDEIEMANIYAAAVENINRTWSTTFKYFKF